MVRVVVDDGHAPVAPARRSAAARRGTSRSAAAIRANGTPSSTPVATAASAFCTLIAPGTRSATRPAGRRRRSRRTRAPSSAKARFAARTPARGSRPNVTMRARRSCDVSDADSALSMPTIARPSSGSLPRNSSNARTSCGQLVVAREVVVFDVRDDRDRRLEQRERTVRLVGLGHEPRRRSVVRVRSQRRSMPPKTRPASMPPARSTACVIAVVVVLPCVPQTAIPRRPCSSCASISPRCSTAMPLRTAATYSGFGARLRS